MVAPPLCWIVFYTSYVSCVGHTRLFYMSFRLTHGRNYINKRVMRTQWLQAPMMVLLLVVVRDGGATPLLDYHLHLLR